MHASVPNLSSIKLRPYSVDDADAAFAIFVAHSEATKNRGYLHFRKPLLEPNGMMFVAEEDGKLLAVGGLQYLEDGRLAVLHTDGVMPDNQRRGIGTALVMARLAAIEEEFECGAVTLLATEFSKGFYARFGFVPVTDPERDATWGFELVGMELPFSPSIRASARQWLVAAQIENGEKP